MLGRRQSKSAFPNRTEWLPWALQEAGQWVNTTRVLSCSADLGLVGAGEKGQEERSTAALPPHPGSLSCENVVCTQCIKGYNSLRELCP